jgi:hypothetical protein
MDTAPKPNTGATQKPNPGPTIAWTTLLCTKCNAPLPASITECKSYEQLCNVHLIEYVTAISLQHQLAQRALQRRMIS